MTRAEIDVFLAHHQESFASRSPASIAADHTEHGTFYSPAAGEVTGRAKIQKVYEYWLEAFPDMEFTWGPPIVEGDRVALFWHFRGTVAGQFFGEVRPGTRIQMDGAGQYVLSAEGIATARHVFDFTGALVSAGVLKVKPV
jgi:predicted ester cyclase